MNPESQDDSFQSSSNSTTEQVQAQCEQLRYLFVLSLASIVLICLAVCVFMGKQWRTVKAQVEEQRKTVQTMWIDYGRTSQPLIREFVRAMQGYSAQDRNFQPILEKYRRPLGEYFAPVTSSQTPPPPSAPK